MQALRATEIPKHFQLLSAITGSSSRLAAEFMSTAHFDLEPRLDTQWLAGMAAAAQISEHAIADSAARLLQQAKRCDFCSCATNSRMFSAHSLSCSRM